MAEEDNQIELELEGSEETEVDVSESAVSDDFEADDDQFKKAETNTQKRIDRLTKKMREAERREQEAINYAKQVQNESAVLKLVWQVWILITLTNIQTALTHKYLKPKHL